jgi:hypothetical protein
LPEIDVRKGMPPVKLSREEFEKRYRNRFIDPVFKPLTRELDAIVKAAWDAYSQSRKSPVTRKAGPGFADPDYEISVDWLAAREAILAAQRQHDDINEKPHIFADKRFFPKRTHLPGRDVEELAADQSGGANLRGHGLRGRYPRPQPIDL